MEQMLKTVFNAVEEKKALKPIILDLDNLSSVTDIFLICSGQTAVQVRAIADNVVDKAVESGLTRPVVEGYRDGRWILLDFGNIIVHVMVQSDREFYDLESLWHDAKVINA
jgi:ribosome-associated protein